MEHKYQKKLPLAAGLFAVALSGCASWFTPGMSELKRLCELDGGDRIYQTVYVDGYYDTSSQLGRTELITFIQSGYQYIEYQELETHAHYFSAIKEPGIWHIYKSNRDDPNCSAQMEKQFENMTNPRMQFIRDFFSSQCLAAKKLDKPESRYWYRSSSSSRFLDEEQEVELRASPEYVEDILANQVIAEGIFYSLLPYRKSAMSYSLTFTCKDAGVDIKTHRFPQSVLLPKNNKELMNDK